jgi:hypothetical protein
MAELENLTLRMLRQIEQKLDSLLEKLSSAPHPYPDAKRPSECAKEIAALTPRMVQQTDSVELLHEDRSR